MEFKASELGAPTFSTQTQGTQPLGAHHHKKTKSAASPGEASQALTVQPSTPPMQSKHSDFHFSWTAILGLVIALGLPLYGIYKLVSLISKKAGGSHEEADYSIPHCTFEETPEGFRLTYRKLPGWMQRDILGSIQRQQSNPTGGAGGAPGLAHLFGMLIGTLISITFGLLFWIWLLFFPTKIEITKDTVYVAGKKLRRADFGHFTVDHTRQVAIREDPIATLGYIYGNRSFKFGGAWKERHASEVAAALNRHLRSVPQAGDENRPSQEELRQAARPADF